MDKHPELELKALLLISTIGLFIALCYITFISPEGFNVRINYSPEDKLASDIIRLFPSAFAIIIAIHAVRNL